jgi:hypothetical protein
VASILGKNGRLISATESLIKMSPAAATFWRKAGLSYLQYLNIATRTVRSGLKVWFLFIHFSFMPCNQSNIYISQEPMRTNARLRESIFYNKHVDGVKSTL